MCDKIYFCLLGNWNGPTATIWLDDQCSNIGSGGQLNLEDCKNACLGKPGCNAINFLQNINCALRKCPQPVPDPQGQSDRYKGYFISPHTPVNTSKLNYDLL